MSDGTITAKSIKSYFIKDICYHSVSFMKKECTVIVDSDTCSFLTSVLQREDTVVCCARCSLVDT